MQGLSLVGHGLNPHYVTRFNTTQQTCIYLETLEMTSSKRSLILYMLTIVIVQFQFFRD